MISYQKDKKERDKKRMYSLEKMDKSKDAVRAFKRKPYGFTQKPENLLY